MKAVTLLFVTSLMLIGACAAIRPAQMVIPPDLSQNTEKIPVSELGGSTRGSYRVGEHFGTFRRSESRLDLFDVLDFRSGSAGFTLAGPLLEGQITAKCRTRERQLKLRDFSFTTKRMAYGCDFNIDGRSFPARFEIQEVREGLAGALMKKERRGEIALDRVVLGVQSVHKLEGSPLQLATPIGYLFLLHDKPVGAIELNGTPQLFLPRTEDVPLQRAVLAAGLALAVFWDPADSSL